MSALESKFEQIIGWLQSGDSELIAKGHKALGELSELDARRFEEYQRRKRHPVTKQIAE